MWSVMQQTNQPTKVVLETICVAIYTNFKFGIITETASRLGQTSIIFID